jgi:hypothetical protein
MRGERAEGESSHRAKINTVIAMIVIIGTLKKNLNIVRKAKEVTVLKDLNREELSREIPIGLPLVPLNIRLLGNEVNPNVIQFINPRESLQKEITTHLPLLVKEGQNVLPAKEKSKQRGEQR